MNSSELILYGIVAVNVIVYALLIAGISRSRSRRLPANPTVEEAFGILQNALKRTFPDLPEGYTWKEVMTKLKSLNLDMDWWEIENTFRKYEDYRYGGIEYRNANVKVIMTLARRLPKGEKFVSLS